MFSVLSIEFLKLRRSKMLLLASIASFLPAMVKYLQFIFGRNQEAASWESFLASGQEFMVMGMLISVVLVSSFVFSMEYQYNTASYIFTSRTSKVNIFISKLISLLFIITFLFLVSAFSQLLFGALALKATLSSALFIKFIKVMAWYIFSYFLLSTMVGMLAVFIKKFVVSAVIVLGYFMLTFPFHLKSNLYISPFMTPTVVAAKLYSSSNYIFTNYYKDVAISNIGAVVFLIALALVSLTLGLICYNKSDAIN